MIEIPWFQDNIWENLTRNFSHYFSVNYWGAALLLLILFFSLACKFLLQPDVQGYKNIFGSPPEVSKKSTPGLHLSLALLILSFAAAAYTTMAQEASYFANYDLMNINTMRNLRQGVTPLFGVDSRLSPLLSWEFNILYAVTHHLRLIYLYVVLQLGLIVFLLLKTFDFLEKAKRYTLTAVLLSLPAFFATHSPVFPEKGLLIFILASLWCLRQLGLTGKGKYVCWFCLWMNLALYSKESAVLFYAGFLIAAITYDAWQGLIVPKSFLKPLQTARKLPLESIIFLSLLTYTILFVFCCGDTEYNFYLNLRRGTASQIIRIYRLEIILCLLAAATFIISTTNTLLMHKKFPFGWGIYGMFAGAVFFCWFITCYLNLVPYCLFVEDLSYYLVIPAWFSLIYLFVSWRPDWMWKSLSALLLVYTGVVNYQNWQAEPGENLRQAAVFLASQAQDQQEPTIFIAENMEKEVWWATTYSTAFKYYWPDLNLRFKTPLIDKNNWMQLLWVGMFNKQSTYYYPLYAAEKPTSGDFYLRRKDRDDNSDTQIPGLVLHKLYENNRYEVYKTD